MIDEMIPVRPGEIRVAASATLATLGLGSCAVVALYDSNAGVGGLAHALLPEPPRTGGEVPPGRFVRTAVPRLVERLAAEGADPARIWARIVGGASMFPALAGPATSLGTRNIEAARAVLQEMGIPILAEDVEGNYGRSVFFHLPEGRLIVRSVYFPDVTL